MQVVTSSANRFFPRKFSFALLFFFFLTTLMTGLAQQTRQAGVIRITVNDQNNSPIPGATVQLKQKDAVVISGTTGDDGKVLFDDLATAEYEIVISKENFESQSLRITFTGAPIDRTLALAPKAISDVVNVTASTGQAAQLEKGGTSSVEVQRTEAKESPSRPRNVADTLPVLPGVARTDQGQLRIFGGSENRSALLANGVDVTDPATGQFGMTIPIDSVQTINVFRTPFLAQYGRFTAGVVSVDTRRGGDKWNFELNDPFPEFRYLGGHLRGLRTATPRLTFNGPLIKDKLYLSQGIEYEIAKRRVLALTFPNNETINEAVNSFTQFDYIPNGKHAITATVHIAPRQAKFFNLDFFNQRPVTPNFRSRDYTGTFIDRWTLGENLLESTVAVKRASLGVWAQGRQEMTLTPTGNSGNYFNEQDRDSSRVEWLESLSLKPVVNRAGTHNLKFGFGLTRTDNEGEYRGRPINIRDLNGQLLRRIEFAGGSSYNRNDLETSFFGQNHWQVTSKLAFDVGTRFERQAITNTFRIAPRLGMAWTPFGNTDTVVRAGYGLFYDRVPLNVFAFDRFPEQIITTYGAGGVITNGPRRFLNIIDQAEADRSPFIRGSSVAGNFAPYSATWTVEVEHPITKILRVRANYQASNSYGLVILNPKIVQGSNALVLGSSGQARYRQFELLTKLAWREGSQLFFSYVRSRSRGDLNEFNNFLGSFPVPVIRPNQASNLPGDMPHRFLMWGLVQLPWKMRIAPLVEWRTGFPYFVLDANQNYVGIPNANERRFPNFFSLDWRMARDFKVNQKYSVRVSFSVYNLTNHFNPPSLRNNIADPQFGLFFGQNRRRLRMDFDLLF